MRPPNQMATERTSLPSRGGRAYPQFTRRQYLKEFVSGVEQSQVWVVNQREDSTCPSDRTLRRWRKEWADWGHIRRFRKTGNVRADILRGNDLVLLAIYRTVFPKAKTAEINAFIGRMNFGNPAQRFYSIEQIQRAEDRLGLSMKVGSTTAYQAFLPINVAKRRDYWNENFPFGMANIRRQDIIDLDEAGVFVETADRKYGKCEVGRRVKQAGPYSKSVKVNIIMAISGDPDGRRWPYMWTNGGTTNELFIDFIEHILSTLPHGNEGRRYVFTMDNLNAHLNGQAIALIHLHGHRVCFRAPYYPIDGAIEYVFNTLQTRLRLRMAYIVDEATLRRELSDGIRSITTFVPYFQHVGFWRTE